MKQPQITTRLNRFSLCIAVLCALVSHAAWAATTTITNTTDKGIFNSGVFDVGAYGNTEFGFILQTKLSGYLGDSGRQAMALELSGGPKTMRINATYGLALTSKQRLKLTFERLDQELDFDFDSGNVSRWIGQNAVGAGYAYLFDNPYINAFNLGGYFSNSPSRHLSSKDKPFDDETNTGYLEPEKRHIAGANSGNVHADLTVTPWPYGRLTGGMDYDIVRFDTKYRDYDVDGLGGHVKLTQRIFPQLKATFASEFRQNQREYVGEIGWLLPSPRGTQLELVALLDYVDNLATERDFYTSGARLNVSLNPGDGTYSELAKQRHTDLLTWTRIPAVRMSTVLAVTDNKVSAYIRGLLRDELVDGPVGRVVRGWTIESVGSNFSSSGDITIAIQSITYDSNSGKASIQYVDFGEGPDALLTITRSDVRGVLGSDWSGPTNGIFTCNAGVAIDPAIESCRFLSAKQH